MTTENGAAVLGGVPHRRLRWPQTARPWRLQETPAASAVEQEALRADASETAAAGKTESGHVWRAAARTAGALPWLLVQ